MGPRTLGRLATPLTPLAAAIEAEIRALPRRDTASIRDLRRRYTKALANEDGRRVIDLALALQGRVHRAVGCELVRNHRGAFAALNDDTVGRFAVGLDSWHSVDAFGRILAGPAWLAGHVSDGLIDRWVGADDVWLRRAALVATVALNSRVDGGRGDARRTLAVCERLVDDREDTIVKALSWALRVLAIREPEAVREFVRGYETRLAARVKREVANKLRIGLKNPRRSPAA